MRTMLAATVLVLFIAPQTAPPKEPGPFKEPDLVELTTLDSTIRLDVRYATANFNYKDWKEYPILDIPFRDIGRRRG